MKQQREIIDYLNDIAGTITVLIVSPKT